MNEDELVNICSSSSGDPYASAQSAAQKYSANFNN